MRNEAANSRIAEVVLMFVFVMVVVPFGFDFAKNRSSIASDQDLVRAVTAWIKTGQQGAPTSAFLADRDAESARVRTTATGWEILGASGSARVTRDHRGVHCHPFREGKKVCREMERSARNSPSSATRRSRGARPPAP